MAHDDPLSHDDVSNSEKRVVAGSANDGPARHFFLEANEAASNHCQRVAAPVRPNDWRDRGCIDRDHEGKEFTLSSYINQD
jgi:hypothetical protein